MKGTNKYSFLTAIKGTIIVTSIVIIVANERNYDV